MARVSLDAGDRARLRRIEAELAAADPALAQRFRRWKPPSAGWTVLPAWALLVFVIGFTTWMVAPAVGVVVAVIACAPIAQRWAKERCSRRDGWVRGRDGR